MDFLASVVIPAHNEEAGILATLDALHTGLGTDELEVVVVCNGCTDRTAAVVREAYTAVRVLEIPEPSKAQAVAVGNAAATRFPRLHLDADVVVSASSLRMLRAALGAKGVLAVGPGRSIDRTGSSRAVAWYYDVWERLPQVRQGLFGRGAYLLSEEGQARVEALPALMSDDLGISEVFAPSERWVVEAAEVVIRPPRTLADLLRRRIRVATGNAQASALGVRTAASRTSLTTLRHLAHAEPRLALRMPLFLSVATVARLRSARAVRAGDFTTWLRDESSRA
ncbi:glycosyltransferase [Nocardioides donggukensis]|uniref:4,4'-diaponeurosporenoate glycosyltransferase n=1 Tax=Nocardioides donggukensis TaxID=2774019 RepID=A0A927Q3D6_9ACTN|nr:glycosyltransferase [Nocardioides donggukensis]MBD8870496.1 glycosyltransferase [Nocardioides donggukensis]